MSIAAYESHIDQRTQNYLTQQAAEERGRTVLGQVQIHRHWDMGGSYWAPRHAPNTAGLPPALVTEAQEAYQAEVAARSALERSENDANAYAQYHKLSATAFHAHVELTCAEARTNLRQAVAQCQSAMLELGSVALAIAEARQVRDSLAQRRALAEVAHKRAMDAIDAEEKRVNLTLATYGVS